MEVIFLGIIVIALFLMGLLVLVFGYIRLRGDAVANRLQSYVAEPPTNRQELRNYESASRKISGSFFSRTFIPGVRRLSRSIGRITPAGSIERLEHQLMLAGDPGRLGAREFYGIQVLLLFAGLYLGITFLTRGLDRTNLALGFAFPLLMVVTPRLWLVQRIRNRQEGFRRAMPDALDMLSVCASAGLGFDQALQRVSDYWKSVVGDEFGKVVAEMSMGVSRAEALRNMSRRVDITELSTFVTLIIQSDQLGMSIADTLHAQADQMRLFRRLRAEEEIRKLPIKILIPVGIFIFPSIIAVILGPSVPVLLNFFNTF